MDTLWTPTDWNKEAELLKEYLGTKIYFNHILIDASALLVEQTPAMILEAFKETGWMIVTDIDDSFKPSYKELTFEEWKEETIWTNEFGQRVSFEELVKSVTDKF